MKRSSIYALAASLLLTVVASGQEFKVHGFSAAEEEAALDISIEGPTEADAGDEVTCRLSGTPAVTFPIDEEDLVWLMGEQRMFVFVAMPGQELVPLDVEAKLVFASTGMTLRPEVRFPVGEAGEYRVICDWNYQQHQLTEHRITVSGKEGEEEEEENPPVPIPNGKRLALILWESEEVTGAQAALKEDLRRHLLSQKLTFRVLDPDQPSENLWVPTLWEKWEAAAKKSPSSDSSQPSTLPVLMAAVLPQDGSGSDVEICGTWSVPATLSEAIALLKEVFPDELD